MAKVMKKVERPVIAYDEMTIMDTLEMSERQDAQNTQNVIAAKIKAGVATAEDFETLDELRRPANIRARIAEQCADMAKFVRKVPSSWFVKSMDIDNVDYRDAKTYESLQTKYFKELYLKLMMGGEQAEEVSGN